MKKIVTHYNPDLDAVCAIWLIVRWLPASSAGGPGWEEAEFEVVPAGKTYQDELVDLNPAVLHVDTGLGKLDHHQTDEYTCAAKKTLEYITEIREKIQINHGDKLEWSKEALERLVAVVNQVDHFQEVYYPDPEADIYEFGAEAVLDGWKLLYREQDKLVIEKGLGLIDGIYVSLLSKVEAGKELAEKGIEFKTMWGRGIAIETKNSTVMDLAQKRGYKITVRRHPVGRNIRIKSVPPNRIQKPPNIDIDLTTVYKALVKTDPLADWYFHQSRTMILNGSAKNPKMKATRLSLEEVVEIIRAIT